MNKKRLKIKHRIYFGRTNGIRKLNNENQFPRNREISTSRISGNELIEL